MNSVIQVNQDGTLLAQNARTGDIRRFQLVVSNTGGLGVRPIREDELHDQADSSVVFDPSRIQNDQG